MNKFNIILIIVSTLLIAQVASAASNYLVTESAPVYPGDTTYVYVPIKNMGFGNFMEDVSVKLVPKENASANAVTILDDVYSLGTITDWGDQRTAKFRIYVNPDTIEGDYYFNVFITYKGLQTDSSNPTDDSHNQARRPDIDHQGKAHDNACKFNHSVSWHRRV